MLHFRKNRGGRRRGRVLGLLPTRGPWSALNFIILMFVNFCLPSEWPRQINKYKSTFPDFSISIAFQNSVPLQEKMLRPKKPPWIIHQLLSVPSSNSFVPLHKCEHVKCSVPRLPVLPVLGRKANLSSLQALVNWEEQALGSEGGRVKSVSALHGRTGQLTLQKPK